MQAVGLSTLADQAELVKLSPQSLTTEEVYRLWPAFNAHYRATAAYLATVVLIQRQRPVRVSLPVQVRNILVQPMERPVIEDVSPGMVATGEQLTIRGRHFVGESVADTLVSFDDGTQVAPDTVQDGAVRVTIPAALLARRARRADHPQRALRRADRPASRLRLQPGELHAAADHHRPARDRRRWEPRSPSRSTRRSGAASAPRC